MQYINLERIPFPALCPLYTDIKRVRAEDRSLEGTAEERETNATRNRIKRAEYYAPHKIPSGFTRDVIIQNERIFFLFLTEMTPITCMKNRCFFFFFFFIFFYFCDKITVASRL